MSYKHIAAIANLHSSGGATRHQWNKIQSVLRRHLGRDIMVYSTDKSKSAVEPTQNAIAEGADLIISVGGDGTQNEVANGILSFEPAAETTMAIIPRGTGSDLRKTLKVPVDLEKAARLIASDRKKKIDVGRAAFLSAEGDRKSRYFLNIMSAGLGGMVDAEVNNRPKWMGGKLSFFMGTLRAIYKYQNIFVKISLDDGPFEEMVANNIVISNGQYFGGGMWVAPNASMTDGLFDVIIFGDMSKKDMVFQGTSIYKGKHLELPMVSERRARKIVIETSDNALIDFDGEQPGRAPLTAEALPSRLNIICGLK